MQNDIGIYKALNILVSVDSVIKAYTRKKTDLNGNTKILI